MTDLQQQYATRYAIMHDELHNLRAQRRKAATGAERRRCEAMIDAKLQELRALRREALVTAELVL